jgi:hypothetical protein
VGEGNDELRLGGARILKVVKITGGHKKHLACANRKCVVKAAVTKDGDEGFSPHAVGQLVCIGMPMWFANPQRRQQSPVERQAAQHWKNGCIDGRSAASGQLHLGLEIVQ